MPTEPGPRPSRTGHQELALVCVSCMARLFGGKRGKKPPQTGTSSFYMNQLLLPRTNSCLGDNDRSRKLTGKVNPFFELQSASNGSYWQSLTIYLILELSEMAKILSFKATYYS